MERRKSRLSVSLWRINQPAVNIPTILLAIVGTVLGAHACHPDDWEILRGSLQLDLDKGELALCCLGV